MNDFDFVFYDEPSNLILSDYIYKFVIDTKKPFTNYLKIHEELNKLEVLKDVHIELI